MPEYKPWAVAQRAYALPVSDDADVRSACMPDGGLVMSVRDDATTVYLISADGASVTKILDGQIEIVGDINE